MTPVLFYGVPEGCSFGSIAALEWLSESYRLCRIQMPEISQSPAYKTVNPIGETPALITERGDVISESIAILNHIAVRGIDKGLGHAPGTAKYDHFNRILSFLVTRFFSAFNPLWFAFEYLDDPAKKAVLREEGTASVKQAFAKLEKLLGDREWLAGDRISMADAYYIGVARWNDFHKVVDWSDYPRARSLFERTQGDPAIQFAHAIEKGENPRGSGAFQGHVTVEEIARQATPRN